MIYKKENNVLLGKNYNILLIGSVRVFVGFQFISFSDEVAISVLKNAKSLECLGGILHASNS